MTTHFHGMTESAYNAFMRGEQKITGPWICSDRDNLSYLHSVAKCIESEGLEIDDADNYCIEQAIQSAILQSAMHGDSFVYVLHVDIPAGYAFIEDDFSCENMDGVADCIPADDLKGYTHTITKYKINPYFAPFILAMLMGRKYANWECAKPEIIAVAESVANSIHEMDSELWFQSEFEYEVTPINWSV